MEFIAIELTNTEQYPVNGDLFPTITHLRLANFTVEVPRPDDNKIGYIEMWFEKGYVVGTDFFVLPNYEGEHFIVEEPEVWNLIGSSIPAGIAGFEVTKLLHQYVVDQLWVDGTLVVLGSE